MRLNDEAKLNLKLLLSRERAREKKKYKNKKNPRDEKTCTASLRWPICDWPLVIT